MIRVYFDWNIFGNLKRETEEPFKSILSIIKNNNGKLLFPYSPAHLRDLKRGFSETEKSKSKTYADLEFQHEISKDHCLYVDTKENDVTPQIFNPTEYFNQLVDDRTLENFDFENLFSDSDDALSGLWKSYMNLMKVMPTGIDLQQIETASEKYGGVKDMFQNLRNGNNFYNLMKDVTRMISKPEEHSSIYKSMRNTSVVEMKINTDLEQWGNAFDYLDKTLAKTQLNKSFRQLIDDNLKNRSKDKPATRFDYFINYYISLDTFGYYRDKELAKLLDDPTHAYYGAHCDIIVTEDNNTYHKAKAVYENFNIATTVCKAADFPSAFYGLNELGNNSSQTISGRIVEIIRYSFILMKSVDDEFNPVTIYKIQHPIADFFNRMQISFFTDSTSLFIYKKKDNYSTFLFWTEIKSIVDKVVLDFGIDDNLKAEFNHEKERKDISDKVWQGRIWKRNSVTTEVLYDYDGFGLALRVTLSDLKN